MKNLTISLLLTSLVLSATAQETKHSIAFKGYLSFLINNESNCVNGTYSYQNFKIGNPSFAFDIINSNGNYHQLELSEISYDQYQSLLPNGDNIDAMFGLRYSYAIGILKSKCSRLKAFLAPGAHSSLSYYHFAPADFSGHISPSVTLITELEVVPVISFQLINHLSIEANVPISVIGLSTGDCNGWFLGPQYFQGRIGLAVSL